MAVRPAMVVLISVVSSFEGFLFAECCCADSWVLVCDVKGGGCLLRDRCCFLFFD